MQRDSFVFYNSWNPLVIAMDDVNAGKLFKAICRYHDTGEIIVDEYNAPIFEMMRRMFAKDEEKYREVCEKKAEAGRKGGLASANKSKQKQASANKSKQVQASANKSKQVPSNAKQNSANQADMICNDMECNEMKLHDMNCDDSISYQSITNTFNSICDTLPKVTVLSDQRRKNIRSRMKEHGEEAVFEVFRKASDSDYLSGRNGKWTNCSFDWLMKPSNFIKVLEGNYDNDRGNVPGKYAAITAGDGDDPF